MFYVKYYNSEYLVPVGDTYIHLSKKRKKKVFCHECLMALNTEYPPPFPCNSNFEITLSSKHIR